MRLNNLTDNARGDSMIKGDSFIISFIIGFILVLVGGVIMTIVVSGGTFGQRCSNYTDSAYQECLIRLSNGGEP